MSTTKDIAKTLAAKHGISQADAELFLQQLVDTVNDGLLADRIVKIKSFGTFKLQSVKDRVSVNVNTGERVNIAGHDKVNFLPDALMKDVVNKPFAQFETVMLDDDTVMDGIIEETADDSEQEAEQETAVEEAEQETIEEAIEESVVEAEPESIEEAIEESAVETEPESIEETIEKSVVEESGQEPTEEKQDEPVVSSDPVCCPVVRKSCRNYFLYVAIMINLLVAVVAFIAGYYASEENWIATTPTEKSTQPAPHVVSVKKKKNVVVPRKAASSAVQDTVAPPKATAPKDHDASPKATAVKDTTTKKRHDTIPDVRHFADPRVRTGAYTITGIAQTVKVKKGQTLESISKYYLGPDMECYVEAVNNGKKNVNAGDELNIPALKLKKKK